MMLYPSHTWIAPLRARAQRDRLIRQQIEPQTPGVATDRVQLHLRQRQVGLCTCATSPMDVDIRQHVALARSLGACLPYYHM